MRMTDMRMVSNGHHYGSSPARGPSSTFGTSSSSHTNRPSTQPHLPCRTLTSSREQAGISRNQAPAQILQSSNSMHASSSSGDMAQSQIVTHVNHAHCSDGLHERPNALSTLSAGVVERPTARALSAPAADCVPTTPPLNTDRASSAPAGPPTDSGFAGDDTQPQRSGLRTKQLFDYIVVYDLEATCDKGKVMRTQEIIELSCVVVNAESLQLCGEFQAIVRPTQQPILTTFCTELTGITQHQVDGGVPLKAALAQHDAWLKQQGIVGADKTWCPATWTEWDMGVQMHQELKWRGIPMPTYLQRWVDLKKVYHKAYRKNGNLRNSVLAAGLEWEGRAHSGLDDARNTARLAAKLMSGGHVLRVTNSFGQLDSTGRLRQTTLFPGMKRQKVITHNAAGEWSGRCECGASAAQRTVKKPGPTNGRRFFSCGRYTMTGGARCEFFKWADGGT